VRMSDDSKVGLLMGTARARRVGFRVVGRRVSVTNSWTGQKGGNEKNRTTIRGREIRTKKFIDTDSNEAGARRFQINFKSDINSTV